MYHNFNFIKLFFVSFFKNEEKLFKNIKKKKKKKKKIFKI